jgi:hypothetical protein
MRSPPIRISSGPDSSAPQIRWRARATSTREEAPATVTCRWPSRRRTAPGHPRRTAGSWAPAASTPAAAMATHRSARASECTRSTVARPLRTCSRRASYTSTRRSATRSSRSSTVKALERYTSPRSRTCSAALRLCQGPVREICSCKKLKKSRWQRCRSLKARLRIAIRSPACSSRTDTTS